MEPVRLCFPADGTYLKVSADLTKTTGFDKTAAARELSAHRIMNITARRLKDRYPRFIGPNSQGGGSVGWGGECQIRIITTDKGSSGWAECYLSDEAIKRFISTHVGNLFDPENGSVEEVGNLDKALHDLAGNILLIHSD